MRALLNLITAAAFVCLLQVLSGAAAFAVCTIGSKTATITPSSVYYPLLGGPPAITLVYNVNYSNITSNNTGPPCTANPTITVTHTNPAGSFSAPSCSFPIAIPNPSAGLSQSGSCSVTWTPIASPAASYTHDASVAALPAQTALAIPAASVANVILYRTPEVRLSNVANGNETGPVTGSVRVTQSNAIPDATTVSLSYSGTASNGTDYNGPLTATIPVGATNVVITLGTLDDAIVEGNETAIPLITGVTAGPATLGTPLSVTNTITDNDTATVSIANTADGDEAGPVNGVMTLTMSKASQTATTINYGIAGSASPGLDYSALPGAIVVPALATSVAVSVPVLDDFIDDDAETVIATLASTSNVRVTIGAPKTAINTIADNDTVGLVVTGGPVSVGEAGSTVDLLVTLATQPTGPVTVSIAGNDATEASLSTSTLSFTTANWNAAQTVTVTGVNDFVDDGDITFDLTFNSSGADYGTVPDQLVSVTTADDDTAGLVVTGDPANVAELGTTANITVVLTSEPTGNVTISLTGNDATEASLSATSLTFTAANWNVAQNVVVTGVDDFVDDGDIAFSLNIDPSGADYNAVASATVNIATTDDDAVGMTVTGDPVSVAESGTTGTIDVVLTSEPTGDVTVSLSGNDATEAGLSSDTLTFTPANWNTPQTVTVTGEDDQLADGSVTFNISVDPSGADYGTVSSQAVSVTNADDDIAAVIVSNSPVTLQEFDSSISGDLVVVLTSEPTGPVTVTITGNDATEASLSTTTLTFTPADWFFDQVVTINGVNDNAQDGDITFDLTFTPSGADYGAVAPATGTVNTIDDDTAGVFVGGEPITVSETGSSGPLEIILGAEPSADVTIAITANDATEAKVAPNQITFTPANWNVAQTVTVTGLNDSAIDGDVISTVSFSSTSSDSIYNGFSIPDATVTTLDDEVAGFVVTGGPLTVSESGTIGKIAVKLSAQPSANVVLAAVSSDATEALPAPSTLTFTPANWNVEQVFTITGVDDSVIDGDINSQVSFGATSADPVYDGASVPDVTVTTTDNDSAGFVVTGGPLRVSESGSRKSVSVKLGAQPLANVVFLVTSSDPTESVPSPAKLTFSSANWNTPQLVTVTGVDDTLDDGDIASTVAITVVKSDTDAAFANLAAKTVAVTTVDNDQTLNDDAVVRNAFTAQTHNFMVSRANLIASHGPSLFRLVNRDASTTSGFQIDGDSHALKGDFALSASAVRHRLDGVNVEPVADVPAPKNVFDTWVEGQFSVYDDKSTTADKGNFFVGYAGLDMRIYENTVVGLMGQIDWAEANSASGKTDGTGWMIGPYMSFEPAENLFVDLRALWGRSDNTANATVLGRGYVGDFQTERLLMEGRVSGNYNMNDISLRPDATLFWMQEHQDDYVVTDSARSIAVSGQRVTLGELSAGLNIGRSFASDRLTIEPFVAGRFTWTFDNPGHMTATGTKIATDDAHGTLSAGLNLYSATTDARFEATYDGLFADGLDSWGGKLEFTHHF
jgi:hypothetical protein